MELIKLEHIDFSYEANSELILQDFSASIPKGSFTVVTGDNGAGKTTLFRILNGLSFPNKGEYIFDGEAITAQYLKDNKNAKLFHKRIGYLFQNPDIMLFNARVYDEIAFGPRQMGLSDEEVSKRVEDCIRLFDLSKITDSAPYHLSGGQKKKVAFASVMALSPEVLILDEPYEGLDVKSQDKLTDFLGKLKENGKTIIIATHNTDIIKDLADDYIGL